LDWSSLTAKEKKQRVKNQVKCTDRWGKGEEGHCQLCKPFLNGNHCLRKHMGTTKLPKHPPSFFKCLTCPESVVCWNDRFGSAECHQIVPLCGSEPSTWVPQSFPRLVKMVKHRGTITLDMNPNIFNLFSIFYRGQVLKFILKKQTSVNKK